ncbi:hypothetical protein LDENG_00222520 [Lucifuga dentata]|nr:hypothetical protein LDENG_00222520 [Lucifuga dentata]
MKKKTMTAEAESDFKTCGKLHAASHDVKKTCCLHTLNRRMEQHTDNIQAHANLNMCSSEHVLAKIYHVSAAFSIIKAGV